MPKTLLPKPPQLVVIPKGTTGRRCMLCPEMIYLVGHQPLRVALICKSRSTGRTYETPNAKAPTATEDGLGWSHFIDCKAAPVFRRPK